MLAVSHTASLDGDGSTPAFTAPDGAAFSTFNARMNLLIRNGIPLMAAAVCSTRFILASAIQGVSPADQSARFGGHGLATASGDPRCTVRRPLYAPQSGRTERRLCIDKIMVEADGLRLLEAVPERDEFR
jgi:hypothetical protein